MPLTKKLKTKTKNKTKKIFKSPSSPKKIPKFPKTSLNSSPTPKTVFTTFIETPSPITETEVAVITENDWTTFAEPAIASNSPKENFNVLRWVSRNEKILLGISFGMLFLAIVGVIFVQIRWKKATKRASENQAVISPKTPKTPETPSGLRERRRIKEEIIRDSSIPHYI